MRKLEKGKSSFLMKEKAPLKLLLKKVYVFSSLEIMFQVFMGMRQTSLLYGPEGKPLYDIKWGEGGIPLTGKERYME